MNLFNKVIIIFGSEGKIGKSFTNHIIKNGGIVCAVDKKKIKKSKTKKNFIYQTGDIDHINNIKKIINKTKKKFKKIDCVINCSYPKENQSKSLSDLNLTKLKKNISSHLGSSIMICKIFSDFFKKQGFGKIILLGSIQGLMSPKFSHYKNTKMYSPIEYTANKHALIGIVKYFAKLYGKYNININSINPGGIYNYQDKKFVKKYKSSCLIKGMLNTSDLISTLEYLLDEKSHVINGQNLIVDDGWSL